MSASSMPLDFKNATFLSWGAWRTASLSRKRRATVRLSSSEEGSGAASRVSTAGVSASGASTSDAELLGVGAGSVLWLSLSSVCVFCQSGMADWPGFESESLILLRLSRLIQEY